MKFLLCWITLYILIFLYFHIILDTIFSVFLTVFPTLRASLHLMTFHDFFFFLLFRWWILKHACSVSYFSSSTSIFGVDEIGVLARWLIELFSLLKTWLLFIFRITHSRTLYIFVDECTYTIGVYC